MDDLTGRLAGYIKSMPSLPTSVSKVLEICNNPKTSPADLNQVISLDPVLVARVLKLINSAYYSMGQQVTSLVRAIIMLGINTVKNLALSTAVMGNISRGKAVRGINMEAFWRHSLCVGVAAKSLAKKRGVDPKLLEEYFTAGLLHDIGKIPLNAILADEYLLAVGAADSERAPLYQAEARHLGIDHCGAGALIVKAWKLEGAVGDAVMHHHNLAAYTGRWADLLYSVAAANRFASLSEIGFSGDRFPEKLAAETWGALGVDKDAFDGIENTIAPEIEKAQIFLKL